MITLLHLTRVDDVTCFKHISFLFMIQKKRLEVNVGEIWNSLSIIVNIGKSGTVMKTLMIPSLIFFWKAR